MRVALTGRAEAYYSDYRGNAQELVSAARFGFLFQGQRSAWQRRRRGTPALDLPPTAFVSFIENHDQVANSERGERISRLTSPGRLRAMTAYLLLGPGTPLLFMGQEFAASSQFMYFADHGPKLARAVASGRKTFLAQFESLRDPAVQARLPNPAAIETFEASKLDHGERDRPAGAAWLALHTDLLALRRAERVFAAAASATVEGAVLAEGAFLLRFFPDDRPRGRSFDERLLVVNLKPKRSLAVAPEPLLAPPDGAEWRVLLTTDDPRYGGRGGPAPNLEQGVDLPAEAAMVLAPVPRRGQG
jgi:maltooligosyltrehalose trehalohydrolase